MDLTFPDDPESVRAMVERLTIWNLLNNKPWALRSELKQFLRLCCGGKGYVEGFGGRRVPCDCQGGGDA